ncbi:uncharacterized protein DEA37_0009738 [Paragonimus westermani]|uniref:CRIB domain-containing protein n=1 Tax=Paragonimus westermani TaxID=34504 RepID=A0A5J4NB48_9TREM|nr:uncharacterized protein DEA37_0009738 [Paragonimus westermani]
MFPLFSPLPTETVSRLTKLGTSMGAGGSTHTGSRAARLTGDRISLPQNDFRHIGHVGSDGRIFGDLGFSHNGSKDRSESSAVDADVCELSADTSSTQNEVSEIAPKQSPVSPNPPRTDASSTATLSRQSCEPFVVNAIPEQTPFCSNKQTGINGTDRVYGEQADRSKPITETDIDSVGLTFGTSLLDEVFKCFSISDVAVNGAHEPASGMDTVQQVDSFSLSDELSTKVSTVCSGSPINMTDDDRADLSSMRLESRSRQNSHELKTTLPSSVSHSSPSRTHPSSSYQNMFSSTADTECSDRVPRPTFRVADGDLAEDSSATPSLRSRWKRSTFGSLTRRSSSVSKVSGGAHSTGTLGRKGSEPPDGLNSNRRLTISRPILIGKPAILFQSHDPAISDPRSSASASCSTITSLNNHCSVSRESLSGLSSTSRDSSLTMISSSNGYAPSNMEDENGLSDTVSYSSHARVNGDELRSIYSCSMSPAQSLCSINTTGRANGLSVDRGVRVLRGGDMVFRAATNAAGGGGGSTLNTRRKVGAPFISSGYTNEARLTTTRLRDPYVPLQNKHRSPDYLSAGLGSNQLLSRLDGLTVTGTNSAGSTTASRRTHEDLSTRMAGRRFSASSSSSSVLSTPSPLVTSPAHTHQDRVAGSTIRTQTTVTSTSGLTCNSSSNLGLLDGTIASFWGSTFADMLSERRASRDRELVPTLTSEPSCFECFPTPRAFLPVWYFCLFNSCRFAVVKIICSIPLTISTGCFESRAPEIRSSVKSLLPDLSSGPSRAIARDEDEDVLAV